MSSSYPLRNDMPRPLCLHCGMVLPRNLYCTNCGYYNGFVQTDISAQETQVSPAFNAPRSDSVSQSRERPEQYNTQPQNAYPAQPSQYPGAYVQGGSSVTPFLGISPNIPSQFPGAYTQGVPSVTPFLGIAPQPNVSRIEPSQSSVRATSYSTQPTLIIPVGLQKDQERLAQGSDLKRISQPKNRNRKLFLGIILLIIVLVGGGLASYLFISSPQKSAQISTTLSSSRPQKPLKFVDAFKNNRNQWDLRSEAGKYSVAIENGKLTLEDDNNSLMPEFLPGNRFLNNFKVTVDAMLSRGDAKNGYGLYIRCSSDQRGVPTTYYRFELYGDGTYAIFKGMLDVHRKVSPNPLKLVSYVANSAIRKRGSSNHIEIDAQGSAMTIRVNGQVVKTFSDPSYAKGTIALFISNIQNASPGAQAMFSNLTVYPS